MNTAAKIAVGISDNAVTNIVSHCLRTNIPVIAAKNGCCPLDKERTNLGLAKGNKFYTNLFINHLETLESYGLKLVKADNLYSAVSGNTTKKIKHPASDKKNCIVHNRKLLTNSDVLAAFHDNKDINLPTGTIITPAAKDTARAMGVKLLLER